MPEAIHFLLTALIGVAAFGAGLKWRDRRREREGEVFDYVIKKHEQRLDRIEGLLKLSND